MSSPRKRGRHAPPLPHGRQLTEPLLPLYLSLGWVIDRLFPLDQHYQPIPLYSSGFTASVLGIVAREIFEVAQAPATFTSLKTELDPLVRAETADIRKRNDKKRSRGQVVEDEYGAAEASTSWMDSFAEKFSDVAEGCAFLDSLEKELKEKLSYADDEEPTEFPEPIERHSPIGVFTRNLLNTLRKLSFDETAHLSKEVGRWCGISLDKPFHNTGTWSLDRKSAVEDTLDDRISAMQDYQSANAAGDWSKALSSLRKFYDYQFPSSGRGQHQHALLNIASFHYMTGGLESSRAAVDEAIRVARTAGDKACLQHCLSLLHRLRTETTLAAFAPTEQIRIHQSPIPSSRLSEGVTPMDQLWSVKAALDLGEPVHIAFRRIHSALGKEMQTEQSGEDDKRIGKHWRTGETLDMAAWHATQAGLWGMLGKNVLAEYHEKLALTEMSPLEDGRLTVILGRAGRTAQRGQYDDALSSLLDMSILHGMSMTQYHRWAKVVWAVLEQRATMHGDYDELSYLLSLHPRKENELSGPGGSTRENGHPDARTVESSTPIVPGGTHITSAQEYARRLLRKCTKLKSSTGTPAHIILPDILTCVQLCSELGLWTMYRESVVLLSETFLTMEGMAGKVIRELDQIWDQILESEDNQVVARAALCLGKAKLDLYMISNQNSKENNESLDESKEYLLKALDTSKKVESRDVYEESSKLLYLINGLGLGLGLDHSFSTQGEEHNYKCGTQDWHDDFDADSANGSVRSTVEIIKLVGVKVSQGWR